MIRNFFAALTPALILVTLNISAEAQVPPTVLSPGATVSPLANGFSGSGAAQLIDQTVSFSFVDGPAGTLRQRVLEYPDVVSPAHPYGGGLYFDYEISLTSGDIAEIIAPGYSPFEVSVKECGIAGCGGSGANGVSATGASRSPDGNDVTFYFDGDLVGGTHSANLQLLTNAGQFVDPFATLINSSGDSFSIPILAPVVPEAGTWAMLLLGFGGLIVAGYRGRARPRVAA